jgi:hypothetical protein
MHPQQTETSDQQYQYPFEYSGGGYVHNAGGNYPNEVEEYQQQGHAQQQHNYGANGVYEELTEQVDFGAAVGDHNGNVNGYGYDQQFPFE